MVTMKFGAAADDAGNLEFTTFHKAATFWVDNFVTPPSNPNDGTNSQHSMTDDVTFLQVGIETTASTYVFPDKLDSRGYSFTVTNPEGHDITRLNSLFRFQNFRHADLTFNRVTMMTSSTIDSAYLNNDSYEFAFYNCVLMTAPLVYDVYPAKPVHGITFKLFNCITSDYSYNFLSLWIEKLIVENNILLGSRNNILSITNVNQFEDGMIVFSNNIMNYAPHAQLPACFIAEAHKNIWAYTTTDAQILASTDPSRLGVPMNNMIDEYLLYSGSAGSPSSYKSYIEYYTPQYRFMKDIIPPEPRAMNPLRYFINGGDYHEWGEQYGPCAYDYQKHMNWDARLTCTPVDNLTMILNWQLPVGLPAKYTKWGIYKRPAPPPGSLYSFRNPAPTKVGTVPINATTFTDNGSVLTNAYNTEMSWRIVPETD